MFMLPDGTVLLNEVAPRPHNSGHYTQVSAHLCYLSFALACIMTAVGEESGTIMDPLTRVACSTMKLASMCQHCAMLPHAWWVLIPPPLPPLDHLSPTGHSLRQDGCATSQFENHVRAVLGWPLGSPALLPPCSIMLNLVGEADGEAGLRKGMAVCCRYVCEYSCFELGLLAWCCRAGKAEAGAACTNEHVAWWEPEGWADYATSTFLPARWSSGQKHNVE
jgi:hypothetical protein